MNHAMSPGSGFAVKKVSAAIAAAAFAAAGLAVPAQAYDRDAFSYAAGHMIGHGDIPKSLMAKKNPSFTALPGGDNFLCEDEQKTVQYPGGEGQFEISYSGRKDTLGVDVTVNQYSSDKKAIRAFNKLKQGLKKCDGPSSGQQTYDSDSDTDPQTDTWSRLNTSGVVPMVTVEGVQSVFLNQNYEDVTTGPGAGRYTSDGYDVYTLVGDVIIDTSYYTGSEVNMSTKQRKAVNQVAFNAVTRWLD